MMSTGAYDTLWHVEANCKSECISWFYLALYKLSWRHIIVYAHFLITYTQFSRSVMSDSLWFHGLKHARLPCPSPAPGACSNSCPLSQWCHSTISFSVVPFSSCLQPFLASGSFLRGQFFASGGQSIGVSASTSVLSMNIQDWFLLGLTVWSLWSPKHSQESSPTPQFKSINSSALSLLYGPTLTSIRD